MTARARTIALATPRLPTTPYFAPFLNRPNSSIFDRHTAHRDAERQSKAPPPAILLADSVRPTPAILHESATDVSSANLRSDEACSSGSQRGSGDGSSVSSPGCPFEVLEEQAVTRETNERCEQGDSSSRPGVAAVVQLAPGGKTVTRSGSLTALNAAEREARCGSSGWERTYHGAPKSRGERSGCSSVWLSTQPRPAAPPPSLPDDWAAKQTYLQQMTTDASLIERRGI